LIATPADSHAIGTLRGAQNVPLTYQSIQEIVGALVEEIGKEIDVFVDSLPSQPRVCFVLDGKPLPAKHSTHKLRARRSYQNLKAARRLVNLYIAKQTPAPAPAPALAEAAAAPAGAETASPTAEATKFLARFGARASGWIRWFSPLKQKVVDELVRRGCENGFDPKGSSKYSVVVAPYEADPRCVDIANQCPNAMIVSNDGDLQIYPYADNALVG